MRLGSSLRGDRLRRSRSSAGQAATASFIGCLSVVLSLIGGVPTSAAMDSGARASGDIVTHDVPPATVGEVVGPRNPSIAMVGARSTWNGKLVLFLPGSGGKPACCTDFLQAAAGLGFHVIGLTYDNATAVGSRCLDNLSCYGEVRQNVFNGTDPTPYSALTPQEGIEARLAATLRYLGRKYPDEQWTRFVAKRLPAYGSIVMSGHSQGGGEAAFIGTERRLLGVILLSSPPDTNSEHQPASWLSSVPGGATSLSRYFSFVHADDPFLDRILADWKAMDLSSFGPMVSVDNTAAPYGDSHELTSSLPLPDVFLAMHDGTAVNDAQPRCQEGASMYVPVWRYLLEAAGGLTIQSGGSCASSGSG